MSIALTVVLAPSRRLRLLVGGGAVCLLAAAAAVGMAPSASFSAGSAVAAALLFAGLCVTHAALRPPMVHRIDISGPATLRLTVQQGVRPESSAARTARLLPGSTLWPQLLLLRLEVGAEAAEQAAAPAGSPRWRWRPGGGCGSGRGSGRGAVRLSVPVLADSLAPDAFRALAVAVGVLGAAAAHEGAAGRVSSTERKIL